MKYLSPVLLCLMMVAACVQAPPPKPTLIIQCPQIVTYDADFNRGFEEDAVRLSNSKVRYPYLESFITDSEGLRDSVRACQKHALELNPPPTKKKGS